MSKVPEALPWIIPERCEGCADCVSACDQDLLRMFETGEPGVFVPWLERIDECTGCGNCEAACPWMAICLTSYVEEAHKRLLSKHPALVRIEKEK